MLGPLVESDNIRPNHDTPPGTYTLDFIERVQPDTARDTAMFLAEAQMEGMEFLMHHDIAEFEYKKMVLGELLSNSEFSSTLAELIGRNKEVVWDEIAAGNTDYNASNLCAWLEFGDDVVDREECADKVYRDIEAVEEINEKIRTSREYFPPTVFPLEDDGDTIDGAHRIVALSSIVGTESEIWVWELQNDDEVFEILKDMGLLR